MHSAVPDRGGKRLNGRSSGDKSDTKSASKSAPGQPIEAGLTRSCRQRQLPRVVRMWRGHRGGTPLTPKRQVRGCPLGHRSSTGSATHAGTTWLCVSESLPQGHRASTRRVPVAPMPGEDSSLRPDILDEESSKWWLLYIGINLRIPRAEAKHVQ